jgi:NADPH:quinone reductase-like Zn-dependent oxidoreductase
MGRKHELIDALPHLFSGRLTPAIDTVMPLAEAAAAHRRLEAGEQFGKIVLEV